jgi:hypothetical protein
MRTAREACALLVVAVAALAAASVYGDVGAPLQPLAAISFLLLCPGLAFGLFLRFDGLLVAATVVLATSVVVDGAVAEILVLTRSWSPQLALGVLIGVSVAGATLRVLRPGAAA